MPKPHEQAAIDAATGARKERLVEAALALDRVRSEYPGIDDPHSLPAPARGEALAALGAFRSGPQFGPPEVAVLVMLLAGLGVVLAKPHRIFQCDTSGSARVACRISERLLGMVTLRAETVVNIASAETNFRVETGETRDSQNRPRPTTTRVTELVFKDPQGQALWRAAESHLLGARPEDVATELMEILAGARSGPLVPAHGSWPAMLAGSVFVIFGLSAAGSALGLFLRDRGFITPTVYTVGFYWGAFLVPAFLFAAGWAIAFFGSDLPAWLLGVMRLV